ncbi:hypothetical protein BpHYR1_007884 [Brachionus plicatilis]|uniref:Uncharacterized protein n=1 Tax=Brachionus plicatilis TaxID=10195 RepID=A0A3M7SVA1_BRAPC|nr:hypothetical protein BpHYR1_007884 [Brachionus plicatilis]
MIINLFIFSILSHSFINTQLLAPNPELFLLLQFLPFLTLTITNSINIVVIGRGDFRKLNLP